jgi:hypothetical protein
VANPTDDQDPRIAEVENSDVYGLFHEGLLIYIGETQQSLQRRRNQHFNHSSSGSALPVSRYIADIDDVRAEISIRQLPFDCEQKALDELGDGTLNRYAKRDLGDRKTYSWTPEELDVVEDHTLREAADRLDASYSRIRSAAKKLGVLEEPISEHLSNEEVRAIWTRYHAFEDASYRSVADRFDTNPTTVAEIIRRETYEHVDRPSKTAINAHHALSQS